MRKLVAMAVLAMCLALGCGMLAGCGGGESAPADKAAAGISIPDEVYADAVEAPGLEDGVYDMDVLFEGGSGKASIDSPATVVVKNGKVAAQIVWSSPNYDYMLVNGVKYTQINDDGGNSVFQIPVTAIDAPMAVVGDTTAMSTPHEIDYTLTFNSASAVAK